MEENTSKDQCITDIIVANNGPLKIKGTYKYN
ncbi:hypothetical protein LCGC14_0118230 [marine sediment metagenome]|uniref:Uncharacterized protein n=1 Tax=marine sediment metagenome TaxID=412755 RepID=A0A0F9V7I9_9ZZZZ